MDRPLHILVVVNLPWDERLGAVRVWFELAEQWLKAGHKVEKFCLTDAFPNPTSSAALYAWRQAVFARHAARFVRRHGAQFDVIDCLIGTLPFSKQSLSCKGLVVGRSVGLFLSYADFIQSSRRRWRDQPRGKFFGRLFYNFTSWLVRRSAERALALCDVINVPNDDEKRAVERCHADVQVIVQPYGLNQTERANLASAAQSSSVRLGRYEICFVGMWSVRKGSQDWPEIVRHIRAQIPDARFTFLGTMVDSEKVFADLQISNTGGIRCITAFDRKELPDLLGSCTVGLFPSYIEGFGISVIEQLAAGIPTIAYDVPGPRQIFASAPSKFLIAAGNATAMAERALEILRMSESDYASLSEDARRIAGMFRWEQIAADTIDEYAAAVAQLPSSDQRRTEVVA